MPKIPRLQYQAERITKQVKEASKKRISKAMNKPTITERIKRFFRE